MPRDDANLLDITRAARLILEFTRLLRSIEPLLPAEPD